VADEDDDVASPLPKRSLGTSIFAFAQSRTNLAIAGGGIVLLIVVLVFALGGSKKSRGKTPAAVEKPTPTESAGADPTDRPSDEPQAGGEAIANAEQPTEPRAEHREAAGETAAEPSHEAPAADPDTEPAATGTTGTTGTTVAKGATGATTPAKKPGGTIGGKQVILEYDNQAREAKPAPNIAAKDDQDAISKARISYAAGNQRLFVGDADGAIRYYRQALAYYPGYVAGYRGLGLAYERKGDKPKALQALRTYVGSVPNAKDAPLIRKRIATLSSR
jgi:tetratricopeptide (TPR) repeat protein